MDKKKELVKNTAILFIGRFCTQFISLLLLPLYTKFLITEDYGIVDLIQTYIILFIPIILLKLDSASFRFLIDERDNEENKKVIITNTIVSAIIQIIIVSTVVIIIGQIYEIRYLNFILLNLISVSISTIFLQISRGVGNNKSYSVASIITGISTIIINIVFVIYLKKGVEGVLIANSISNILCIFFLILWNKILKYIDIKKISKQKIKELLKYSIPMIPNELSWWVVQVSDRTIISIFIGIAANGIYSVSCKFSSILTSIFSIFNMSWHESASMHIDAIDREEFFTVVINKVFKIFTQICMLLLVCIPIGFNIVIGEQYKEAYVYIPILLLANIFNILVGLLGGVYIAKKLTKEVAKTTIVSAVINIFINILLIKSLGIYAASISTLISYIILAINRYIDVQKYIKIKLNKNMLLQLSICIIISMILYYYNNIYGNILNLILVFLYVIISNRNSIYNCIKKVRLLILK